MGKVTFEILYYTWCYANLVSSVLQTVCTWLIPTKILNTFVSMMYEQITPEHHSTHVGSVQ